MSEVQAEPEIKVEWDPERYEESMAAIQAWAPEGVGVELDRSSLLFDHPRRSLCRNYRFKSSGLLTCQYEIKQGLIVLLNKDPYLQAIKNDEAVSVKISRLFAWELCQEQIESLELKSSFIVEFSLLAGKVIHCKWLNGLNQLTSLNLSGCNSLIDISTLSELQQLTSLNLRVYNSLVDISILSGLTQLTSLYLERCESLVDIHALSELT